MNQYTSTNDQLDFDADPPKLSSGLNVLTILTFTWCGISALLTLAMPAINDFLLKALDKALTKDHSAKELADIERGRSAIESANQHMIPLMVIAFVGIILCFVGALWMRKLKKDGYWLYIAGELLPIIGTMVILGTGQYSSIWSILLGIGIPVLFVILYTLQRKYLVR